MRDIIDMNMTENNDGRITEEALKIYRSRVGRKLRVSDVFNDHADRTAVRRFCDGIGESNPLYLDPDYAASSVWGAEFAPPSFIVSVFPGWILQGLPGVHAFHTSTSFKFNKPVPLGAEIIPESTFTGFRSFPGKLGHNGLLEKQHAVYHASDGTVFAEADVTGIRVERERSRAADIYKDIQLPHPWTRKELADIAKRARASRRRGSEPLFIEDLEAGNLMPETLFGPLGLTDIIAYCIGACPIRLQAGVLALQEYDSHPKWAYLDEDSSSLEPIFGVHYSRSAAVAAGMPAPYDLGTQRHAILMKSVTDWIGDYGWIQSCEAQYTGYVFLSDVMFISGRVTAADRAGRTVKLSLQGVNQRGEKVLKGKAAVLLPSKRDPEEIVRMVLSR